MHEVRIGVSYDFRNPVNSGVSDAHLYAEILEQVKWLDQIGADMVWFTEHHFVEDGYLPSWVPVAGAMAAVTSQGSIHRCCTQGGLSTTGASHHAIPGGLESTSKAVSVVPCQLISTAWGRQGSSLAPSARRRKFASSM